MKATGKCGSMLLAAWLLSAVPALAQILPDRGAQLPQRVEAALVPVAAEADDVGVPMATGPAPGAFGGAVPPSVWAAPVAEGYAPAIAGVDRVRVSLTDNSQLIGQLAKDAKFEFKSKFGKLALAIGEVTGIEDAGDNQFSVTLENGDRMTGEVAFGDLKLKTAFGEVPLARKDFMGLEVGKLYEQRVGIVRPSPDGRTTITVYRTQHLFQPNHPTAIGAVTSPYYAPTTRYIAPEAGPTAPTITPPSPRPDFPSEPPRP
jgi:hypothetical protein